MPSAHDGSRLIRRLHEHGNVVSHIQSLNKQTAEVFRSINNRCAAEASSDVAELQEEEENAIDNVANRPLCFVIVGSNAYAKAALCNRLLKDNALMPLPHSTSYQAQWYPVRIRHGPSPSSFVSIPTSYEIVSPLELKAKTNLTTLSMDELEVVASSELLGSNGQCIQPSSSFFNNSNQSSLAPYAILEVRRNFPLLENAQILVLPSPTGQTSTATTSPTDSTESAGQGNAFSDDSTHMDYRKSVEELLRLVYNDDVLPVILYAVFGDGLSAADRRFLDAVKQIVNSGDTGPNYPEEFSCLYISVPAGLFIPAELTDVETHVVAERAVRSGRSATSRVPRALRMQFRPVSTDEPTKNGAAPNQLIGLHLFQELSNMGLLSVLCPVKSPDWQRSAAPTMAMLPQVLQIPSRHSWRGAGPYQFPESELCSSDFAHVVNDVQHFVEKIVQYHQVVAISALAQAHDRCLQSFVHRAYDVQRDMSITPKRIKFAMQRENELYEELNRIAVKGQDRVRKIVGETIQELRPQLITQAEQYVFQAADGSPLFKDDSRIHNYRDLKQCYSQLEEIVLGTLNMAIASRLLSHAALMRDGFTGTLNRCLVNLEASDVHHEDFVRATVALRDILRAAYELDLSIKPVGFLSTLLEKMRQLLHSLPWSASPRMTLEWRRRTAQDMLGQLSERTLAKSICSQFRERLKESHEQFRTALQRLDSRHNARLERARESRMKIRKEMAPRVAQLCLETVSLRDLVLFGKPNYGKEIGRGQYGVVFSCEKWAEFGPCAVKSMVPDEKHLKDLALEYYYTKRIPEHPRIVQIHGSIVDYSYAGGHGHGPEVLLIMERYHTDLNLKLKHGMDWSKRLQVAQDVVEGVRFLHSQGLIHRDIKLKNVLLDRHCRALIADMGFCKPEPMMTFSIVGTPIHMAPELVFSGHYDATVDVYAFGILFWYICANKTELPKNFSRCSGKNMLWDQVKDGLRPERLECFSDACWQLMSDCWASEPSMRPLLGDVARDLMLMARQEHGQTAPSSSKNSPIVGGGDKDTKPSPSSVLHNNTDDEEVPLANPVDYSPLPANGSVTPVAINLVINGDDGPSGENGGGDDNGDGDGDDGGDGKPQAEENDQL